MKDYTVLKDRLTKEKQITTKDIVSLGFSQYDIKVFIENNILTKVSRGLYYYRPSLIAEETEKNKPEEQMQENNQEEQQKQDIKDELNNQVKNATYLMIKKENDKAIKAFEEVLEIEPSNQYARFAIFACFMFKKDFVTAYNKLIQLYNNRINDELLFNIYYYMLLLKQLIPIDEKILNDIANIIATEGTKVKRPQDGSFTKKLIRAISEEDWEKAFKYANINISIDRNQRKYHLTNQCYRFLVIAVIKSKNLIFERKQEEPVPEIEIEEEPTIIVPQTTIDQTIKQNLLLEAINSNDYQTALTLLEQEKVENPELIIKTLLTKLHSIQSLITTTIPVKVTTTENVRLVDENELETPKLTEKAFEEEKKVEKPIVTPTNPESNKSNPEQLINAAYMAYKEFLTIQNFEEARRNLQRYEYLINNNGAHRNIKYHYNRIALLEQEYTSNPNRYFQHQDLQEKIFQAKKRKSYKEVLSLISEYKRLGGIIQPIVQVIEAEMYIMQNDLEQAEIILSNIKDNEEPSYFTAKARIYYEQRKFEECITMCIAYNDRRPSYNAANYIMLANCYKRLNKPSKALKALRKADEINKAKNYIKDLSSDIADLEYQSDIQKEIRLSMTPKKK